MTMSNEGLTGRLFDTYAAALQHDAVELPPETTRLGVVRRPTPWLSAVVDDNRSALAPPDVLLEAMKTRQECLHQRGLDDVTAHNRAMVDVQYGDRYDRYLRTTPAAQSALRDVRERLDAGEDIALVCFENTAEKRCHRTRLRSYIEDSRSIIVPGE